MEPFPLLVLLIIQAGISCHARNNHLCAPSACGEVGNIRYPFRLKDDPKGCGDSRFELACEDNYTVLSLFDGRYHVKSTNPRDDTGSIDWDFGHIELVDVGLQKGNCSSLPLHQLMDSNFTDEEDEGYYISDENWVTIVSCSKQVRSSSYPLYFATEPCIAINGYYSYAVIRAEASDIEDFCTITTSTRVASYLSELEYLQEERAPWFRENRPISYDDIHNAMTDGFNLSYWVPPRKKTFRFCFLGFRYGGKRCIPYYYDNSSWGTTLNVALSTIPNVGFVFAHFLAAKFIFGAPCVLIILIYKWLRRHRAMDMNIEEFLQAHNNFLPIRYSYSDIKKITKNFKHKLGEGGYGSVYRGVLRSGNEVAVKILHKSKSNGQDFISEVATIGRIHHVNVVQLVGFCFNYSKQALVYDFMLNGSLDKHIFYEDGDNCLDHNLLV